MKAIRVIALFITGLLILSCNPPKPKEKVILTEEAASKRLGELTLEALGSVDKKTRISLLYFHNLDGKDVPEGFRLESGVISTLVQNGYALVQRADLDKIISALEKELSGTMTHHKGEESRDFFPVDIVLVGTVVQEENHGEASVRVINTMTGEIQFTEAVAFKVKGKFSYKENLEKREVHRKAPGVFESINLTYKILSYFSVETPAIFLLVTYDKDDPFLKDHGDLIRQIEKFSYILRKHKPNEWRKIERLRKNLGEMRKYDHRKYGALMEKKNFLLTAMGAF